MVKKRRYDPQSAQSEGLGYLLRRLDRLDGAPAISTSGPAVNPRSAGSALDVTVVVAASNAAPAVKAAADYVCDGVDDQVEIILADEYLSSLTGVTSGTIVLSEGNFAVSAPINIWGGASLRGSGQYATSIYTTANVTNEVSVLYVNPLENSVSDLRVRCNHDGYDYVVYANSPSADYGTIARVQAYMSAPTASGYSGAFAIGSNVHADHLYVPNGSKGDGIIFVGNSDAKITNCTVLDATADADGIGAGINLWNLGSDVIALGNFISGTSAYDIYVAADNCIVVGNHCETNGIDITSDASGTVVGLNLGTVTDNGTDTESITSLASPLTTKGDLWGYDTADSRIPVGADGTVLVADSAQALGLKWDPQAGIETEVWGMEGTVTTGTGTTRLYAPVAMTLVDFRISLSAGTATVDVHKDGTTVFTTQANRPAISSGNVSSLAVPDVTSVAADSYLTIDVDAASSAEDLIVTMRWRKT